MEGLALQPGVTLVTVAVGALCSWDQHWSGSQAQDPGLCCGCLQGDPWCASHNIPIIRFQNGIEGLGEVVKIY